MDDDDFLGDVGIPWWECIPTPAPIANFLKIYKGGNMDKTPLKVEYDEVTDVLSVDGRKITGDFFRNLHSIMPVGVPFFINKRDPDGALQIQYYTAKSKRR